MDYLLPASFLLSLGGLWTDPFWFSPDLPTPESSLAPPAFPAFCVAGKVLCSSTLSTTSISGDGPAEMFTYSACTQNRSFSCANRKPSALNSPQWRLYSTWEEWRLTTFNSRQILDERCRRRRERFEHVFNLLCVPTGSGWNLWTWQINVDVQNNDFPLLPGGWTSLKRMPHGQSNHILFS
jgi:hypothetical protein